MIATDTPPVIRTRLMTGGFLVWTCGILLPVAAIAFEAATSICAVMVDPMPGLSYLLLLLTVPTCNLLAWLGLRRDAFHHRRILAAMTGFSAAIALFYTVLFMPVMPIALVGLIVVLPVLAFAPILSFMAAARLMHIWRGFAGARPIVAGTACAAAVLVALALPAIAVRVGADMADSGLPWLRDMGFHILQLGPVRQALLEDCQPEQAPWSPESIALLTGRDRLAPDQASQLFYRVTGKAFDSEPVPHARRRPWMSADPNRGGERIGAPVRDVSLRESRLEGNLDAASATAYMEWTMVFHNSGTSQQEARMEIAVPPDGVVSRVTLWVHGEEREAAFGGNSQVRQAYSSVVQERRDPLLVSSSGPGRVMVQCFPVEPAADMKIRIGLTAPVVPEELSDRGVVALPAIVARNFEASVPATVRIESKSSLAYPSSYPVGERTAVRLSGLGWGETWVPDGDGAVAQRFMIRNVIPPEQLVVVVDGSESMRGMRNQIAAALAAVPAGIPKQVMVVTPAGVKNWPAAVPWFGGVNALPALAEALGAAGGQRTTVVWIAGEQPVKLAGIEPVRQMLRRERGRADLSAFETAGVNLAVRDLDGLPGVQTIPRFGGVASDLQRFFARWRAGEEERVVNRELLRRADVPKRAEPGSPHIVPIWAAHETAAMAAHDHDGAVALAVKHRIVTPLTGAVVLESAAQYRQNSLDPPGSPSTISPEPATCLLVAAALVVLVGSARSRRSPTFVRRRIGKPS